MRLSEWRAKAPFKNSVAPKVIGVVESALAALGSERDPECWVAWGDDPTVRYLILVPTPSGLVQLNVRVYIPNEGPRASGKVVRWNRVQLGELAVEIQAGHRLVTFQVETQVLTGADAVADRIAGFAQVLFAAVDGRASWTAAARTAGTRSAGTTRARSRKAGSTMAVSTKAGAPMAAARKPATRRRREPRNHDREKGRSHADGPRTGDEPRTDDEPSNPDEIARGVRARRQPRRDIERNPLLTAGSDPDRPSGSSRGLRPDEVPPASRPPVRPARSSLPGPAISPIRRTIRYWASRVVVAILLRAYLRVRLEDRDRLPSGPAIYCFNHLSWADPFVLMAALPFRPRLWFFGPKQEDMRVGGRNRLMHWTGTSIPYKPGKNDLLDATRRVAAVIGTGSVVAIAGEGRIHVRESELLPLSEGAAYFALRSGIPLVPMAINGTSRLRFGGRIRIRVGEPIESHGRPSREAVSAMTAQAWSALHALIADAPDLPEPGRLGRWLSERFNDWPEGSREAAQAASEGSGLPYSDPPD